MKTKQNISIIWDFDKTLTPKCSTGKLVEKITGESKLNFWKKVDQISDIKRSPNVERPRYETVAWMSVLAKQANDKKIIMDQSFFKEAANQIELYKNVIPFLKGIKNLSQQDIYKKNQIEIHHFIITGGLKDLISEVFNLQGGEGLVKYIFGSKYHYDQQRKENIPIYCMDNTIKTRSLFEIHKACFLPNCHVDVDDIIPEEKIWCPFKNMIYIGDGASDIPAFTLLKLKKGMRIGINLKKPNELKNDNKVDFYTTADFSIEGKLFEAIKSRCNDLAQKD